MQDFENVLGDSFLKGIVYVDDKESGRRNLLSWITGCVASQDTGDCHSIRNSTMYVFHFASQRFCNFKNKGSL